MTQALYLVEIRNGKRWSIAGCMVTAMGARRLLKFMVEGRNKVCSHDIRIRKK